MRGSSQRINPQKTLRVKNEKETLKGGAGINPIEDKESPSICPRIITPTTYKGCVVGIVFYCENHLFNRIGGSLEDYSTIRCAYKPVGVNPFLLVFVPNCSRKL
jgi:hypothetical protein